MLLSDEQWELVDKVNCAKCKDREGCDAVKYDCPRIDFKNMVIDEGYEEIE